MKRIQINTLSAVSTLAKNDMQATVGGLKVVKCFKIPFTHKKICFFAGVDVRSRRR